MKSEIVECYAPRDDMDDGENSYYDEQTTGSKSSNWILNTGWRFGKKLVMTCVVMSSVPVVLPPLILISALGCALSLPFGVVFASYAFTEKLMSKLLVPSPEYDQTVLLEEEEEEQLVSDFVYEKDDSVVNDAVELVGHDKDDEFIEDVGKCYPENVHVGEIVINTTKNETKQPTQNELMGPHTHAGVRSEDPKEEDERILQDKVTVLSTAKGKKKARKKKEVTRAKLGTEIVEQETSRGELSSVASDTDTGRCVIPGSKNNDDDGNKLEKQENTVTNASDTGVLAIGGDVDEKIEHGNVTIYNDPGAGDGELKNDVEVPEVKDERVAAGSDEGLLDDEKIWKKMEVIRVIVGYKAPRSASYLEELKALYMFTGIEAPSDSTEFDIKLCFLMSVIGLK